MGSIATVVYDEECAFCRRSVAWLRRRDSAGRLVCIGCRSAERRARFPALAESDCLREMWLFDERGAAFAGGDAAAEVLCRLPRYGLAGLVLRAPVVRHLARRVYRTVARNRHALGCKTDHCEL